ncbi:MAG: N-acetylgalactosamine-6-sulfatase [Gemmatales bacterium]|nr:MAG: N-acetylgalactosamine-6-sulfatase [Gemmatales bacterium]
MLIPRWFVVSFVFGILPNLAPVFAGAASRPNIVLIFVDDLGYGELGCQGNPQIPTPNIDSIAKNGVRFTAGYVSAPYCCPSRAGLLTGRYQTRFGHELNAVGKQNLLPDVGLPLGEHTIADYLKKAGYVTGIIGKWHLGATEKYHPLKRGFDEFFGFTHEGHFYVPPPYQGVVSHLRSREPKYDEDNPIRRNQKTVQEPHYLTHALTREAVAFIDRHRRKPFFLYLAYNAVHSPMQAALDDVKKFEHIKDEHRRVFAGMLAALDDGVGKVLRKLRACSLEEKTLIFFISDNGGPTAELTSSNRPLRGGKGQLWEGGIRIPFLVQWKGQIPAGKVYSKPVISLDVLPTALAAAGVGLPKDRIIDGVDLLPYLTGKTNQLPHDTLFWRYGHNMAVRQGDWKLVRQNERGGRPKAQFQLYNLAKDISETEDLASTEPVIRRRLLEVLDRFNAQMVEPRWGRRSNK